MVSLIWVSRGTHHPLPRRDRHRRWSHHTHRGQDQLECLSYTLFWPQGAFCTLHWSKTPRPGTTSCQKRKEKKDKNPESEHFGAVKTSWEGLHPTYLPRVVVRGSFLNTHVTYRAVLAAPLGAYKLTSVRTQWDPYTFCRSVINSQPKRPRLYYET